MTSRRKANLIVEEAQAGLIVMDELVVDLVLGLPKLFHRALEISPRDVVVAEHLTAAGDDDLPILHRVLRESILIDLVTNGLLLPLSETLDDLLLVLLESPLGNAVSSRKRCCLLRIHSVRQDDRCDREHSYSDWRNIERPHEANLVLELELGVLVIRVVTKIIGFAVDDLSCLER